MACCLSQSRSQSHVVGEDEHLPEPHTPKVNVSHVDNGRERGGALQLVKNSCPLSFSVSSCHGVQGKKLRISGSTREISNTVAAKETLKAQPLAHSGESSTTKTVIKFVCFCVLAFFCTSVYVYLNQPCIANIINYSLLFILLIWISVLEEFQHKFSLLFSAVLLGLALTPHVFLPERINLCFVVSVYALLIAKWKGLEKTKMNIAIVVMGSLATFLILFSSYFLLAPTAGLSSDILCISVLFCMKLSQNM